MVTWPRVWHSCFSAARARRCLTSTPLPRCGGRPDSLLLRAEWRVMPGILGLPGSSGAGTRSWPVVFGDVRHQRRQWDSCALGPRGGCLLSWRYGGRTLPDDSTDDTGRPETPRSDRCDANGCTGRARRGPASLRVADLVRYDRRGAGPVCPFGALPATNGLATLSGRQRSRR